MIEYKLSSLEQNKEYFKEYRKTVTGLNDDFWEGNILTAKIYRIYDSEAIIGIYGICDNENLTLFYVIPEYLKYSQEIFSGIIRSNEPKYAFAATNDELFLSLCMDFSVSVDKQAYFFEYGVRKVRLPEFGREYLSIAELEDEADILDTENVAQNIKEGKYYIMRKDGVFLGQGFFNPMQSSPATSIGMSVHPDHRRKGVGRSIIMHMADICREKNTTPVCGCWYYNNNSKRTLESAGFVTKTRLLKIWFVKEE